MVNVKQILKDKRANVVEAITVVILILVILIVSMQVVFLITSGQLVRERFRHSLTLLEASITQDVYDGLQDKDFEYYKSQIITDNGTGDELLPEYEDLFIDILQKNIEYDEKENKYVGEYFSIDADSLTLSVVNTEDNAIKLNVNFDVDYFAYIPLLDRKVNYYQGDVEITSDYSFNDLFNSEEGGELVTGEGNVYESIGDGS